jgi:CRP-like cAMP-binding protein
MEFAARAETDPDAFGEMQAGTAGDHQLAVFGPGERPFSGADVTLEAATKAGKVGERITLDEDEVDITNPDELARATGVIVPTQSWKETWDVYVLMLILYSAVMVPYRICFSDEAEGNMWLFEVLCSLSFLADVCMNFNTAFLSDDEHWVTSRKEIAMRYLSGWFWIDAPSSIPVELIDVLFDGDTSQLSILRFLRLFRLLRLLRLLKLGEYIAALEIKFDINLTFLRIVQMVLNMLFLAHMLGCFWFYTAAMVGIDPEITTWVQSYDDGSALDGPPSTQYLYSVYWALTTLTTVGYGDITPTNNAERKYSLFALLIGALVFGFMLSSIGSLVAAVDRQAALSEERMDEVKEYMRWRKLPRDLVMRMRRYYTYYYSRKTAFDESAILGSLSPSLRFEVVDYTLKDTIGKIPLFSKILDPMFMMEVFPLLKPLSASPKELICAKGEASTCLFFLIKGQVEVISGVDGRVLYRIQSGQFFGESVLTGRRRAASHRGAGACEMMIISTEDLQELFTRRPREGKIIYNAVLQEHVRKERMRNISLRLLMNRLGRERKDEQAAIRLQIAWNKMCDASVYRVVDFDADDRAQPKKMSAHREPATPMNIGVEGESMSRGTLEKLDKLDVVLEKLDQLSRQVGEKGHKSSILSRR